MQEPLQGEMQRPGPHRFRPGESGNPGGKRAQRLRLEQKVAEYAAPYGGVAALAPDEIELLRQAAILSRCRIGDTEQRVRVANALRSIFELLANRHRKGPGLPAASQSTNDEPLVADVLKHVADKTSRWR
jgi:hypothetical protein